MIVEVVKSTKVYFRTGRSFFFLRLGGYQVIVVKDHCAGSGQSRMWWTDRVSVDIHMPNGEVGYKTDKHSHGGSQFKSTV